MAKILEHQYWSVSPSNEYLGLISFRIDWLDLLVVQGTLKSLLQTSFLKVKQKKNPKVADLKDGRSLGFVLHGQSQIRPTQPVSDQDVGNKKTQEKKQTILHHHYAIRIGL